MDTGAQQNTRRLVKVRKRKILSDSSNLVPGSDKENGFPLVKRVKKDFDSRPLPCVEPSLEWSLKTKARFISYHSFEWAKVKRARQESQGLAAFIQGQTGNLEPVCELQSHLKYFEHPSIPSIGTFAEGRQRTGPAILKETAFLDALKEDWSSSFRSLFQLFRLGTCSHFYLCAASLTILFMTSDPGSSVATISPTTSGFRRALTREGVEFSMPLNESPSAPDEPQDHESESEDECSSWLDSVIGPEERTVKKINTTKSGPQCIDSRPESTVLIPTSSLQSLFNYLLNCKTLVSPTGPMAGVPPTLISPVAFQGATLRALKVTVGNMSDQSGRGLVRKHYMDVIGPILPHSLKNLKLLLNRTQQHEFTAHTIESEHTTVFSKAVASTTPNT